MSTRSSVTVALLACSLGIAAPPALAQQPTPGSATAGTQQLAAIPLTSADLEFLLGAASYAYAGIAAAKLALARSDAPRLRTVAQAMLEDHTAAVSRLREIAAAHRVAFPKGTTNEQKLVLAGLRGMRGNAFERDFLQRAAINEHWELIALLHEQATAAGRDPELARFAATMLPKIHGHVALAQSLHDRVAAESGRAAGAGG